MRQAASLGPGERPLGESTFSPPLSLFLPVFPYELTAPRGFLTLVSLKLSLTKPGEEGGILEF